jgi:hypothetical protein
VVFVLLFSVVVQLYIPVLELEPLPELLGYGVVDGRFSLVQDTPPPGAYFSWLSASLFFFSSFLFSSVPEGWTGSSEGILYCPPAHLPRSISLHLGEQNGLAGFSSHVVTFLHMGQIILI